MYSPVHQQTTLVKKYSRMSLFQKRKSKGLQQLPYQVSFSAKLQPIVKPAYAGFPKFVNSVTAIGQHDILVIDTVPTDIDAYWCIELWLYI